MTNADLKYAALVCALMLALAACTRVLAVLPVQATAGLLELAALAQLGIGIAALGVLSRRERTREPQNFMNPYL